MKFRPSASIRSNPLSQHCRQSLLTFSVALCVGLAPSSPLLAHDEAADQVEASFVAKEVLPPGRVRIPANGGEKLLETALQYMGNRLKDAIQAKEAELQGKIGFAYDDPTLRAHIAYRGEELFHAASTMKTPVMIEVFRRAELGDWDMDDEMDINPMFNSIIDNSEFKVKGDDYMQERHGKTDSILNVTEQMMVVSDNLATNLLIQMAKAPLITENMRRLGVEEGYVLRGVSDIPAYRMGMSNRLSARGLNIMNRAIEEERAAGPEGTAEMRRILLGQEFNDMIPRHLPEGIKVGHKTGSITGHRHDSAIVYAPEGPYYLSIMVAECPEIPEDSTGDDAAKRAAADLSKLVWDLRHEILNN